MVRILPERLFGDDDAEVIENSLEYLVEMLRLLSRFLGLSPNDGDDDDDDKSSSNSTRWLQLSLTLLLPAVIAILYCYCRSRRNMDGSYEKKTDNKVDEKKSKKKESSSSSSSSSESSLGEESGWFSKVQGAFRIRILMS